METPRRSTVRVDGAEGSRRLLIGGLLGIVWFLVLLIPEGTRLALIGQDRAWWRMLTLMVVASALVSLLLVACLARHKAGRVFAVVALPAILALVYSELVLLVDLASSLPTTDLSVNPDGPLSALAGTAVFLVASFFLAAPIVVAGSYVTSILITLPMGYVHVRVLQRWASGRLVFLDRQEDGRSAGSRACAAPPAG